MIDEKMDLVKSKPDHTITEWFYYLVLKNGIFRHSRLKMFNLRAIWSKFQDRKSKISQNKY